jgi:hypothetical protein
MGTRSEVKDGATTTAESQLLETEASTAAGLAASRVCEQVRDDFISTVQLSRQAMRLV